MPEENPKDFVKPLTGSDVLLLWIGKCGRHRLPMAHNVLDGHGHEVVTAGRVPVGSWPASLRIFPVPTGVSYHPFESRLVRFIRSTERSPAMRVCRSCPDYQLIRVDIHQEV